MEIEASRARHGRITLHVVASLAVLAALVLWMQALGRPLFCPCGTVRLWAPAHDSQQFADWYSLLHVSFGLGLFLLVDHFQPRWPAAPRALVALLSSTVWEAIENLPAVIARFNAPGASYSGDTILNAMGDTLFVMIGFALAARLSARATWLAVASVEIATWFAIRDGFLAGTARLLFAEPSTG